MKRKMEKAEGESRQGTAAIPIDTNDPVGTESSPLSLSPPKPPASSEGDGGGGTGDNNNTSRFLVVNGIRYVRPYLREQIYSARLHHAGLASSAVLAAAFHRRSNSMDDTVAYMSREIREGRVRLNRHKKSKDDIGPYVDGFQVLVDPDLPTEKGDRFKVVQHVHERCVLDRGCPLPVLATYPHYTAVFKPAGLPTLDEMGGHATVLGLMEDRASGGDGHRYHLGHRLDRPVSGVTILGRSKSSSARLIRAVAPEARQRDAGTADDGGGGKAVLKAYVARAQGRFVAAAAGDDDDAPTEVNVRLGWDGARKRAVIVADATEDGKEAGKGGAAPRGGRDTVTRVRLLHYDGRRDQSVLRVELGTGARHQIRAVLADHLGLPIVGDTQYGGPPFPAREWEEEEEEDDEAGGGVGRPSKPPLPNELRLYADDEKGSLLRMLRQEEKDWCDKCRWQLEETANGGTIRGTDRLEDCICLLSYHYKIPSLGIDVCVPDRLVPKWAKMTMTTTTATATGTNELGVVVDA